MTLFFKRLISLTVDTLQLDGFDATFHIEKSLEQTPNTLDLRVYNLNKDHREQIQKLKKVTVLLKAGYGEKAEAATLPALFFGNARNIFSLLEGPTWTTYITSGDGELVNREARLSQSFSVGTFFRDVMNKVIDEIQAKGVVEGNSRANINNPLTNPGFAKQFINGTTVNGKCMDILTQLSNSCGMQASIQDMQLQVLKKGSAIKSTAVLLSPSTGLIGSPQRDLNKLIKARSLLNPDISPGRLVSIDSIQFKGFYRVEKATYIGDTSGQDWYVDIEAREVTAAGDKA